LSGLKLNCCQREAEYEVEYETYDTFLVCSKCIDLPHFARNVKLKKDLEKRTQHTKGDDHE